jgi:hypothetical protein
MMEAKMAVEIEYEIDNEETGETEFLYIEGDGTPYVPAKLSGPPENCYPAEGGETWIISILDADGKPWKGELTDSQEADVDEKLFEALEAEAEDAKAEAQIAAYEARMEDGW